MKRTTFFLLASLCLAVPAGATGAIESIITPHDQARLDKFEATRADAIAQARAGGAAADLEQLEPLIAAKPLDFAGLDLGGEWQCRTIKLGKTLPLVVYGWFRCRITDSGAGWELEKISGSQRTKGRFFDDGANRLIYLGSSYTDYTKRADYGAGPQSDDAGYVYRSGENTWRIEFPEPYYESVLDILEFRR